MLGVTPSLSWCGSSFPEPDPDPVHIDGGYGCVEYETQGLGKYLEAK